MADIALLIGGNMVVAFSGANNTIMARGATARRDFIVCHSNCNPVKKPLMAGTTIVRCLGMVTRFRMTGNALIDIVNLGVIYSIYRLPRIGGVTSITNS